MPLNASATLTSGPYQIDPRLERGGSSVVYLAREPLPRDDVTLKEFKPVLIRTDTFLNRFRMQTLVLSSFSTT